MKRILTLVAGMLLVSSGIYQGFAADAPAKTPGEIFANSAPENNARGILFQENYSGFLSVGYIRYSHTPTFDSNGKVEPSDYWNWRLCTSWQDSNCVPKAGHTLEGFVFLGKCLNDAEIGCVESLRIRAAEGTQSELKYVGPALENIVDTPESKALNIPRSSTHALFQDEKSNLFIVRALIFYIVDGSGTAKPKLDVDVYPVLKVADPTVKKPEPVVIKSPESGLGIVTVANVRKDCLAITEGVCYKQSATNLENQISLALRLPKEITGWFKGRLKSPTITVNKFSETSNLVIISANPVAMPVMGGWVKYDDLPSDFITKLYPSGGLPNRKDQKLELIADSSSGSRAFEEFSAWAPYLKDKALTTTDIWSFGTNFSPSKSRCMTSSTSIGGVVTTNASVYSSEPPTWDPNSMTLDYKIAAPHFNAAGEVNVGTYTLAISNEVIKCLYGLGQLPASATVSIVYGDTSTNIGTIAVGSKAGWSYFSANGFHFSSPTVRVKFADPNQVSTAAPVIQAKKAIWCSKGKAKKKITDINPACPKGFKKIANPAKS